MKRFQFSTYPQQIAAYFLVTVVVMLVCLISPLLPTLAQPQTKIFDEVWQTVNNNFFDPKFNGVNWVAVGEKYKPQAITAKSKEEFTSIINQMLSELRTSHTRYYTPYEPAYYQLLGIFQPREQKELKRLKKVFPQGKFEYTDIGIFTKQIRGKNFVSAILDDSPAAKVGLKVGDELLSVNGQSFQAIQSFAGQAGKKVKIFVQNSGDANNKKEITVIPKLYDTTRMFLDAQKASTKIISRQNKKIGYVHIWSNAADPTQQQLIDDLIWGRLKDANALILDFREGWGGGTTTYLNFFTGEGPSITNIPRNRPRTVYDSHWKKPVVMLVNEGSRSSKEIIAYAFQRYKIGTVIGSKTLGAVVGGRPFVMEDGSLLYVAVADVLVDNNRLEGKGVTPDITIPFALEYAQDADPQKEKAIEVALQDLSKGEIKRFAGK
jgi:carboxyl-terminal processing protease